MGGKSSSSSAQTTYNQDYRVAVQDGIGLSASNNNTITITDGGLVSRALDSVDLGNAINADGFTKLLQAAENLWDRGETLIGTTQKHVADAYAVAQQEARGAIDQRTIVVLAVVAGVALVATNMGRK